MISDIARFITIAGKKNGRIKITQTIMQQSNLYDLLHELGFCQAKVDNKRHFYQRIGSDIVPRQLFQVKNAFVDFIKAGSFLNLMPGITQNDILNWYHENDPIKNNDLFLECLKDELTIGERHILKLKTDQVYARGYETKQLLGKFQEWKLKKTIDLPGNFLGGSDIYYKNIGRNDFLVFNHYKSKSGVVEGFDTWIAAFKNENQIVTKKADSIRQIKLCFHLDNDFDLINRYIN